MLEFRKSVVAGVIEIYDAGDCVGFLQRMKADRSFYGCYWNGETLPFAIVELARARDYFAELYRERKPALWQIVQTIAQPAEIPALGYQPKQVT